MALASLVVAAPTIPDRKNKSFLEGLVGGFTDGRKEQQTIAALTPLVDAAYGAPGAAQAAPSPAAMSYAPTQQPASAPAMAAPAGSANARVVNAFASLPQADFDRVVRTVYGEAASEGSIGQQAVAAVIRNRAQQSGKSLTDVVMAPNQFEPWGNPATRAKLEGLDPNSPAYQSIAQAIRPVLSGEAPDPTGGADHFYAPKAQAALGRSAPAWDNGSGQDIGGHRFLALGYGGSPAAPRQVPTPYADAGGMSAQTAQTAQGAPRFGGLNREAMIGLLTNPETRNIGVSLLTKGAQPEQFGFTVAPDGTLLRTNERTGAAEPLGNYARPQQQEAPSGFQFSGGQLQPIPGGPADPSYRRSLGDRQAAPSGYAWVDPENPAKGLKAIPGGPAGAAEDSATNPYYSGKYNVEQGKVAGYADRISDAEATISAKQDVGTDRWQQGKAAVPFIGNELVSNDYQQLDQAQRNFINSVLRRESGAAIGNDEFDNARKQYFPQPGDSPETLGQKKRNRETVYESFAREAGPNYKPRAGKTAAPAGSAGSPPEGVEPQVWQHMTPEERALWQ